MKPIKYFFFCLIKPYFQLTAYSARNSDSIACKRFNSQASSNDVKTGSRELRHINELDERARN